MSRIEFTSHPLEFKKPAKTSRDTLKSKPSFFLTLRDDKGRLGKGECSLIPGLSLESESEAIQALEKLSSQDSLILDAIPDTVPAVKFAVETTLIDLKREGAAKWKGGIPINGLVWMESAKGMLKQVQILVKGGYKTIKLKVGTLPFFEELELLKDIRVLCPFPEFTLRVDANGAFSKTTSDGLSALEKLQAYEDAGLKLHSIEQPIEAGSIEQMAALCASSPIPIALDEELIPVILNRNRQELLEKIKPAYIILKPSILGGFISTESWINIAESLSIGWWITSALESNLGLSEISEWTYGILKSRPHLKNMAQGLGTGSLFKNNIETKMFIAEGQLYSSAVDSELAWSEGVVNLIKEWNDKPDSPLLCKTSGSSGVAREISHSRAAVIASAKATLEYFNLQPGDKAILALPIDFIAGKMMVVRSLIGGLDLDIVEPKAKPLINSHADFIAITPHQCSLLISDFPDVKTVLLGGGVVTDGLIDKLPEWIDFYEGFGMTETITHIAMRKVKSGESRSAFEAMSGVSFQISKEGELIIDAPSRGVNGLVTDDIVELVDSKRFVWLGRKSSIIISGGIKVIPEVVEHEIRSVIQPLNCEYLIKGVSDDSLGEKIILRLDTVKLNESKEIELLREISKLKGLAPYHKPRDIEYGEVAKSNRGKIKRIKRD